MRHPEPKFDANACPSYFLRADAIPVAVLTEKGGPGRVPKNLTRPWIMPRPLLSIAVVKRESGNLLAFAVDIPASARTF